MLGAQYKKMHRGAFARQCKDCRQVANSGRKKRCHQGQFERKEITLDGLLDEFAMDALMEDRYGVRNITLI